MSTVAWLQTIVGRARARGWDRALEEEGRDESKRAGELPPEWYTGAFATAAERYLEDYGTPRRQEPRSTRRSSLSLY